MSKLLLLLGLPGVALLAITAATSEVPPPISALAVPAVIVVVLVLLNGLFVAAKFSVVGVRPTQIENRAELGERAAKQVLQVLKSPRRQDRYIATAQLGITLASLGLGMYAVVEIASFIEPWLAHWLPFPIEEAFLHTLGYIISVSLLTYLHVIVGKMVPKSLARINAEVTVLRLNALMQIMRFVLGIPVWVLHGIGRGLMHLLRVPPSTGHELVRSPEELEHIVTESALSGLLQTDESDLLSNIIDFSERQVAQVMTPRPRMEAISLAMPLPKVLEQVAESNYSRFPLYAETPDNIIGIVHVKDLLRLYDRPTEQFDLRLIARPVPIVPESYPLEKMLTVFRHQRTHLAVVMDEYGGTAGIVTLEDLVEEIMGEVRDEFDVERDEVVVVSEGLLDVDGQYLLIDLADYNVPLGSPEELPDVDTVGGLILAGLGRPPQIGDSYQPNPTVTFTVTAVNRRAVSRARVEFTPPLG